MNKVLPFLSCLLFASAPSLAADAETTQAGHVLSLQGQASALGKDGERPLAAGSVLDTGDTLKTARGTRLLAELNDGTELTLGAEAEFTIDELVLEPGRASALFRLTKGAFRMVGGAVARQPGHRMEIAAPIGTIGIRGTDVWGGSLISPLDVFLIEGEVSVTSQAGRVILDQPGQGTSVPATDAPPLPAHPWKESLYRRAFATVSFGS